MQVTESGIGAVVEEIGRVGRRLVEQQSHAQLEWKLKEDGTFITRLDLEAQNWLEGRLAAIFPGCLFIGEEGDEPGSLSSSSGKPRIVLDPIDGTAAYSRGLNFFGISLAIIDATGEPLLAVIHLPAMSRWWVASFDGSASTSYSVSLDRGALRIQSAHTAPAQCTGWKLENSYLYLSSDAHRMLDLSAYEGKCRALGATATHLALLLDSTIDPAAVVITRYRIWDVAAGLALAGAAGFEIRAIGSGRRLTMADVVLGAGGMPPLIVGSPVVLAALREQVRLARGC